MNVQPSERQRLFFALWPDAAAARELQGLQEVLSGRKTHIEDFHLTLAFLGEQPDEAMPALKEILFGLSLPEIPCLLDTYGCFSRLKLVWAGMSAPPQSLFEVRRQLLGKLGEESIAFPQEAAFRPHITLARKVNGISEWSMKPIRCASLSLVLARSVKAPPGSPHYRILASRQCPSQSGSRS